MSSRYNLIVKIHKDGSVFLESRIENAIQNYNQYLVRLFQSRNSCKVLWSKIILEANDCREEINITEEIEMDPKDSFTKQVS